VIAEYDNDAGLKAADANLCLMLIDAGTRQPLALDYASATSQVADGNGAILRTEVELPLKYQTRNNIRAVVFLNGREVTRREL
jgi:hypothetical protein